VGEHVGPFFFPSAGEFLAEAEGAGGGGCGLGGGGGGEGWGGGGVGSAREDWEEVVAEEALGVEVGDEAVLVEFLLVFGFAAVVVVLVVLEGLLGFLLVLLSGLLVLLLGCRHCH